MKSNSAPIVALVGTPRSGTTLATRLVRELPGVSGPSIETHFFDLVARPLVRNGVDVRDYAAVGSTLSNWTQHPRIRTNLDVEAVLAREPKTMMDLFRALIEELADMPIEWTGSLVEKTPAHLWMWPLFRSDPSTKVVALVRDPRAVSSSARGVPWGDGGPTWPSRWLMEFHEIERMKRAIAGRVLIQRYEDLLEAPEAFKTRVGSFLTASADNETSSDSVMGRNAVFPSWEEEWKGRSSEPVDRSRAEIWRSELRDAEIASVEAVCASGMRKAGYERTRPRRGMSAREVVSCIEADHWRQGERLIAERAVGDSPVRCSIQSIRLWTAKGADATQRAVRVCGRRCRSRLLS